MMNNPNFPSELKCITGNHEENPPDAVTALIEKVSTNNKIHFHGFCYDCFLQYAGQSVNQNWFIFKSEEIKDKIIKAELECFLCKNNFKKEEMEYILYVNSNGHETYNNLCLKCIKKLYPCSVCSIKTKEFLFVGSKIGEYNPNIPEQLLHEYKDFLYDHESKLDTPHEPDDVCDERAKIAFIISCIRCKKNSTLKCTHCNENFLKNALLTKTENNVNKPYCLGCHKKLFCKCKRCGTVIMRGDENLLGFKLDIKKDWYCEPCILSGAGNFPVDPLEPGFKRVFEYNEDILDILPKKFHGDLYKKPTPRLFGLELEFVSVTPNDYNIVADFYKRGKGRLIVVRDGSIAPHMKGSIQQYGLGLEIVSVPLTFGNLMEFINDILYNNSNVLPDVSCGIHIHTNKAKLTAGQVAKMMIFGRSPFNYNFISLIAERWIGPQNQFTPLDNRSWKEVIEFKNNKVTIFNDDGTVKDIKLSKLKPKIIQDKGKHYHWLNFTKAHTIEFRIFASSTNIGTVKKDVEFIDALLDVTAAGEYKFTDFYTPNIYLAHIQDYRKDYPNLFHFLDKTNAFQKYYIEKAPKGNIEQINLANPTLHSLDLTKAPKVPLVEYENCDRNHPLKRQVA